MHYLVTGGCGFIGLHLVRQLLSEGHNVTIIDDLSNSTKDNVPPQATLIVQDITVAGVLDALVQKVDGVFHLAAVVSVVKSTEAWKRTHEVTLGGMVALLDALARFKRHIPVVYCSSAAVYGDKSDVPFREDCHCTPISAYGADKLSCELHARVGYLVHGVASIGLRFFNVYGEGQDPHSPYAGVISIFAGQMRASQPVTIYGDGEQIRDYIHVSDVVTAMGASMKALERKSLTQNVFNICTGVPLSVNALAGHIMQLTGSRSRITHAPTRTGDIRSSLGDPSASAQQLGFAAKTSVHAGLELLLKSE